MSMTLEIRQSIINEFICGNYLKRTSQGLADTLGIPIDRVEEILSIFPEIFTKITGCKGEMWILNDTW